MTSVSDWTVLSGAASSKLNFLTFFIFHIMVYAFNLVSHVPPPHSFIFHFNSLLFFEFFDFVYFSEIFHPWKTEQGGALTGPPLVTEQGGVYNPLPGFFLLPGHLGGFIERCS